MKKLIALVILCVFAMCLGGCGSESASAGIIGGADGPTSIFLAGKLGQGDLMGPIAVAAYSYMALVPIVQPPVIKLLTTKKERKIRMKYEGKAVSKTTRILFPIVVSVIAGVVSPQSAVLIGFLMFGNLIRECGVLDRLSESAQHELANLITILLGLTVSTKMHWESFLNWQTIMIMLLGLVAFVVDTFGGIMIAKIMNLFTKNKINPMIGAAGISAFPMSGRIVHKMGLKEDPQNFLLMLTMQQSSTSASSLITHQLLTVLHQITTVQLSQTSSSLVRRSLLTTARLLHL